MKKSNRKMRLHRDTLHRLDAFRAQGGTLIMTPGPCDTKECPVSTNGDADCCLNNHTTYTREG